MPQKNYILTKEVAGKKLRRMAYEILENNFGEKEFILAGIKDNGCVIARNMQRLLNEIEPIKTEFIGITLDKKLPKEVMLSKSVPLNDKVIIVIDDVSNSGKTLLYALKPLLEFHPKKIQTLVLVERRHNAFPVKPDYVGLSIATTLQEHIYVEIDGENVGGAWLE
ncbi:MAG TPA: phosphoribosyltransferase family protein [Puia sp.]|nr:phosphoribosyltransferase family protein [Puia sp.]